MIEYTKRLGDELAIFLLHGVVKKSSYKIRNYTKKHLEVDYFREAMMALKEIGVPMSLDKALHHIETKTPFPKNAFAVTFDDGFENNYSVAAPVLEELNIPATIYMSTGMISKNSMSWTDRIELCFELNPEGKIRLPWEQDTRHYSNREDLILILDEIRRHVKTNNDVNPDEVVKYIYKALDTEEITESNDPLDQKLSWQQIADLHTSELFTVGGHAHDHEIMSFLSPEELTRVVSTSISLLKEKAGMETVEHYSYPEGMANHYSQTVIDELKAAGVRICPTAIDGTNTVDADPFHLRRVFMV